MTDFMEIIRTRRSIRKYLDKEVPENLLNQVLEAVRWAPSWANTQCWEIVVVKDRQVKQNLQAAFPPKGNPATKAVTAAPVVLAVCGKCNVSGYYKGVVTTRFGDWQLFDLGIATQNICLAAHALGLATVIAGLFDHDKAKSVVKVPDGYELVAIIPMGFPAKTGSAPKRREIGDFTHYDTF